MRIVRIGDAIASSGEPSGSDDFPSCTKVEALGVAARLSAELPEVTEIHLQIKDRFGLRTLRQFYCSALFCSAPADLLGDSS
jgi:hypothetical protein